MQWPALLTVRGTGARRTSGEHRPGTFDWTQRGRYSGSAQPGSVPAVRVHIIREKRNVNRSENP